MSNFKECLSASQGSEEKKIQGLQIEAAFQREGEKAYLELRLTNKMNKVLSDFAIKFNDNPFKLNPEEPILQISSIQPGNTATTRIPIGFDGLSDGQIPTCPYKVQVAFKTNLDIFVFYIPCSLTVLMIPNTPMNSNDYQAFAMKPEFVSAQNKIETSADSAKIKKIFADNNISLVGSRTNKEGVEMVSYSTRLVNGMPVTVDTIFDKENGVLQVNYRAPHESILPLFYQALGFLLKL